MKGDNRKKGNLSVIFVTAVAIIAVVLCTLLASVGNIFNRTDNLKTTTDKWNPQGMGVTTDAILNRAVALANNTGHTYTYGCIGLINEIIEGVQPNSSLYSDCASWGSSTINGYNADSYAKYKSVANQMHGVAWWTELGMDSTTLEPGDIIIGDGHALVYLGQASSYSEIKNRLGLSSNIDYVTSDTATYHKDYTGNVGGTYWTMDVNGNGGHARISNYNWTDTSASAYSWNLNNMRLYRFQSYTYGKFSLNASKVDRNTGNKLAGAKFHFEDRTVPPTQVWDDNASHVESTQTKAGDYKVTGSDGNVNLVSNKTISGDNTYTYSLREDVAPDGYYIDASRHYGIQLFTGVASGTNEYRVTSIKIYGGNITEKDISVTNTAQTWQYTTDNTWLNSGTLSDKTLFIINVPASSSNMAVGLTQVNPPYKQGQFSLNASKMDRTTGNKLEGAKFHYEDRTVSPVEVWDDNEPGENQTKVGGYKVTGSNGSVNLVSNRSITEARTYKYSLREIVAPEGYYIDSQKHYGIDIRTDLVSGTNEYRVTSLRIHGGNITEQEINVTNSAQTWQYTTEDTWINNGTINDKTLLIVNIPASASNMNIEVTQVNPKLEGNYHALIGKKSSDNLNGNYIAGINYEITSAKLEGGKTTIVTDTEPVNMTNGNVDLKDLVNYDSWAITELDSSEQGYASQGYLGTILVHRTVQNNVYVIDYIELTMGSQPTRIDVGETLWVINTDSGVELVKQTESRPTAEEKENAKEYITLNSNSEFTVIGVNKKLEGSYDFEIKKVNETNQNEPVEGVTFTVNGEEMGPTGEDGTIKMSPSYEITKDNLSTTDEYTITEVDLGANTGLVKLNESVSIFVTKHLNEEKTAYEVYTASFADGLPAQKDGSYVEKQVTLEDGTTANAKLQIINNTVQLTIPNKSTGEYKLNIGKKSKENNAYTKDNDEDYLADAKFSVEQFLNVEDDEDLGLANDSNNNIISAQGASVPVTFSGNADIEITDADKIDLYRIKELEPPSGYTLNEREFYLEVHKKVDETTQKLVIDDVDVYWVYYLGDDRIKDRIVVSGTLANNPAPNPNETHLYGTIYNYHFFRVDLDKLTNTITFTIGNEKVKEEGSYNLQLIKEGTDGRTLTGVKFSASAVINGVNTVIADETNPIVSGISAVNVGDEVVIGTDTVATNDVYTLKELSIGEENEDDYYIGLTGDIVINVSKESTTSGATIKNKVTNVTLGEMAGATLSDNGKTLTSNIDGSKITVSYYNGTITLTVKNPKIVKTGDYKVNLKKLGTDGTQLQGVQFEAKGKFNNKAEVAIPSAGAKLVSPATGTVDVIPSSFTDGKINIDPDNINTPDVITLKEVGIDNADVNSKYYLGLEGKEIKITVNKNSRADATSRTLYVESIGLTVDGQSVPESNNKFEYTATNGSKVIVEYVEATKTIEVTVSNPKKEGSFKLNLIKTIKGEQDENDATKPKALSGARFKITVNQGTTTLYNSDTVDVNGLVTDTYGNIPEISGLDITADNLTYTITVEELSAPDGYIGIGRGNVRTFTATSTSENGQFKLVTADKFAIENDSNISATIKENEILIEAENRAEPVIHKGIKNVENQDSGYDKNEIQNWVINTTVPAGISDYTKYIVTDTIDFEKTNVAEKRIKFINEDHPEENVVVKYKGTNTVLNADTDYTVTFDKTTKLLTVTFIDGSFKAGQNLNENSVLEITYKTQFSLDANGNIIGINQRIPNKSYLVFNGNGQEEKQKESEVPEVHTGGVGVYKYDSTTNTALQGAKFKISRNNPADKNYDFVKVRDANGNEIGDYEVETDSTGHAKFEGLEFGEDAINNATNRLADGTYTYDWSKAVTKYYLVETYVPGDYILLTEAVEVDVKADNYEEVDLTEYHNVGNTPITYEGQYNVQVIKYGKSGNTTEPISGVKFKASRTINGLASENLGTLTDTDSTGTTQVGSAVTIDKNKVSEDDIYIIQEESVPENSEYYIGFDGEIKLTISKQSTASSDGTKVTSYAKSIKMEIDGVSVTKVSDTEYKAQVTKDGQVLDIVAKLENSTVTLTLENPHKNGNFDLEIIKYIKGTNPKQNLAGAGFKVSITNNSESLTDKDGNVLDGSHEYFVENSGEGKGHLKIEGLNIKQAGLTYNIRITESTVPEGYTGIGDAIEFTATSVLSGNKLVLDDSTDRVTVSNDVVVNYSEDKIWVDIENRPEPVIHKGVKTVENQDSGYDKNEIQTWVINSTVPQGIGEYTKYVVTDEIDPEISNVADKRIVFQGLDSVHVKIIGQNEELVQGIDYLATFNNDRKILIVTFIDGTFTAGQSLQENSTIEIKFNTKFALDVNGNIIGLNQAIPNEAVLTYNANGSEDKTKKSERPEVHTGGVGVFKYDQITGKALVGAHFKITRSQEKNANGEYDFVKVRDEAGNETDVDLEIVTGTDGKAKFEGLEFGEDAIKSATNRQSNGTYTYDWSKAETEYYIVETMVPEGYEETNVIVPVVIKAENYDTVDLTKYYNVGNKPILYDLSLRKFITQVDDTKVTDRIPNVTLTDEFKDESNNDVTTAEYNHTKEPVIVKHDNIVTYTIRIYNEGPNDAFAAVVKDDIPDGLEFIPYTKGDGSINDKYSWRLVDANDKEVIDVAKAKYIVTDYLSMENGTIDNNGNNSNLLKAFDSQTMNELDYRDVKVQFKVTEPQTSDRIITNYAQIAKMTNSRGTQVKDRDSTQNVWVSGEDDQDIENIKLVHFDLALRKWVTKAIVMQNGKTTVTETGHHAEDDPEDVVKVDLKKSKVNSVVVKFEYQIRVTNEGKIGGWADEVTDHIPNGLKFEQSDNPIWTQVDEKTIVTDALADTYLEPGESAEVTVVLTWENSADNLGIKDNIAEISKDRNKYGVNDIDSIPGNYKWGEDDIDDAPVMLAITTGNQMIQYMAIAFAFVVILGVGVKLIKRNNK